MEKLELIDDIVYSVSRVKVDGLDVEKEIAILEQQQSEISERLDVLNQFKVKKDAKAVQGTTIK